MRLLVVVPRYGDGFAGGAEAHVRALVERCCDGWEVDVATTCATSHETWENTLPAGVDAVGGRRVLRFPVTQRRSAGLAFPTGGLATLVRLGQDVWSEPLHRFLVAEGGGYDLLLFAPYLFGTTFWGAQVHPERTALLPCLHDEPEARSAPMRRLFQAVRGCVFNTDVEAELARGLYGPLAGRVVGIGIDPPAAPPDVDAMRRALGVAGPYAAYVGRCEAGKGLDWVAEVVRGAADQLPAGSAAPGLVAVGGGSWQPPAALRAVLPGYVEEDVKRAVLAGAAAFVIGSELESLSIATLEAWREGAPVIVRASSPVLRRHVERSGGGVVAADAAAASRALAAYVQDAALRRAHGEAGRAYVRERYAWERIRAAFRTAIEELAA